MAVAVWTGFTLTWGTAGIQGSLKVKSIAHNPGARREVDVTHQGSTQASGPRQSGGMEFLPGKLPDPGTFELEVLHDPTVAFPLNAAAELFTLTPPNGVAGSGLTFTGFLQGPPRFSEGIDTDPVASITIKCTGIVNFPSS